MKNKLICLRIFIITGFIGVFLLYEGADGPMLSARGNPAVAMATTIDIEGERILTLEDVVFDYDRLYDLLTADKFENITRWDGVAGQYTIGQDYG